MKKKRGWIALLVCLLFFTSEVAWAGLTFKAPFTSDAVEVKSGTAATVDGPDGWYTWVDTDGVLQGTDAQASPSARIETDGVLVEGMGVNIQVYSNTLDTGWVNTGTSEAQDVTSPDGVANSGWTITDDNDAGSNDNIRYITTVPQITGVHTASVFVKKGTSDYFSIAIYDGTGVTGYRAEVDFQWVTGVPTIASNDAGAGYVGDQLGTTGWYRVWVVTDSLTAGDNHRFYLTASRFRVDPGAEVTTCFYGAQLEKTPYVTSYIPTSGASAVRWSQEGAVDTTEVLPLYNTTSFNIDFSDGSADCQTDEYDLDLLVLPVGSDKYRIVIEDDEDDQAVGYIYADDAGQAGGILVSSTKDGSTRNWNKDGGFNEADDEYDVYVEFVDTNGIYWAHADLWETDWATDMDPEGTMSVEWTPGYAEADAGTLTTGYGIIALSDAAKGFLYHEDDSNLYAYDGTNTNSATLAWALGTTYDVITSWDASTDGDIFIDGVNSDGAMDAGWIVGTNLILGFDNPYPFHIKDLRFYDSYSSDGGLPGGRIKFYPIFEWPLR